jgi:hypothetical protein
MGGDQRRRRNNMAKTITISVEAFEKAMEVRRDGKTEVETIEQCIKLGAYQLSYRTKRNKVQAAEQKMFREWKRSQKDQ